MKALDSVRSPKMRSYLAPSYSALLSSALLRVEEVRRDDAEVKFGMSHVSTGYEELDDLLFGGILEGYAVVLTSPSCDERDLLLRRFLEREIEKCTTFYVSNELGRVVDLVEIHPYAFQALVCYPQADLSAPNRVNVSKTSGVDDLSAINISLVSAIRNVEEQQWRERRRKICVNVISDVLLRHRAFTTRRWLSALLPRLKAEGFTILATLNSHMHPREDTQTVVDLFDGQMDIQEREIEGKTQRILTVKKMYQQKYMETELILDRNKLLSS